VPATWKSTAPLWVMGAALTVFYVVDRQHRATETDRLRAEIRALQDPGRRNAGTTERVVVRQPILMTQVVASASAAPSAAVADGASRVEHTPQPEELEAQFQSEPRAPAAAARQEGVLQRALTSFIKDKSAIESVECRAGLCRLQLAHPDVATSNALIEKLFFGPDAALHGASFVALPGETMADGSRRYVLLVPSAEIARLE
jgi:hypothetical protein